MGLLRSKIRQATTLQIVTSLLIAMLAFDVLAFGWRHDAAAQENDEPGVVARPVVLINQVDDTAFPRLVANVSVSGQDGLPLLNLMAEDFQILEDGQPVPVEAIAAESDVARELRLVLALDISTTPAVLAEMKQAAGVLLETLGPRDRLALITFGDDVTLVYPLTNNKAELQTVLAEIEPAGDSTLLNTALLDGLAELNNWEGPPGYQAVIVLTDSIDNSGAVASGEVNLQAREANIPLYIFGFGQKVQADILNELIRSTGGFSALLPGPAAFQDEIETLAILLRQSYRVSFLSSLTADNERHEVSIAVDAQGGAGEPATASFIARPAEVAVVLPGIFEGQTVEGAITLDPQITTGAPIASVKYLLDDQLLAEIEAPPYKFTWDSTTAQAASHMLAVIVTDIAGNEGRATLNLDVFIPPTLNVILSTPQSEIKQGQEATVQASVEPAAEVTQVEFYLDDTLLAVDDTAPYSVSFDTAAYEPGQHVITARAQDQLAQVSGAPPLTVDFVKPTLMERFWASADAVGAWFGIKPSEQWPRLLARTMLVLLGLFLIIAIILIAMSLVKRILLAGKKDHQRLSQLLIQNLGNIRSRYELRAEDPTGLLNFQFIPPFVPEPEPQRPAAPQPSRGQQAGPVQPAPANPSYYNASHDYEEAPAAASQPRQSAPAQAAPASGGFNLGNTASAAKEKLGILNTIGTILGTVGAFLPRSVSGPLLSVANSLRMTSSQANRAIERPRQLAAAARSVQGQAGSLAPARQQNPAPPPRQQPSAPASAPSSAPALRPTPIPAAPKPAASPPPASRPASALRPTPVPSAPSPPPASPSRPSTPTPAPVSRSQPTPAPSPAPAPAPGPGRVSRRGSRTSRSARTGPTPAVAVPAAAPAPDVATLPVTAPAANNENLDENINENISGEANRAIDLENDDTNEATTAWTPSAAPSTPPPAAPPRAAPSSPVPAPRRPSMTPAQQQFISAAAGGTHAQMQTPFVEPGQDLTVDLIITPAKPNETRDYPFHVTSWAVEQPGAEPVVEQGQIHVQGISLIRRLLPFLFSFLVIAAAAGLVGGITFVILRFDLTLLPFL